MPPRPPVSAASSGLLRIPYTDPLPAPKIIPPEAGTLEGAIGALVEWLLAPPPNNLKHSPSPPSATSPIHRPLTNSHHDHPGGASHPHGKTLVLSGAGLSVASGLADYRGENGTYRMNRSYRPVFFAEFVRNHEARKRYWARSFLGWEGLKGRKPNEGHIAIGRLGNVSQGGELGLVSGVITQNVDSLHQLAHPSIPVTELHGALRTLICLTCRTPYPRPLFQSQLAALNPSWADFLSELVQSGALETEDPEERRKRGLRTNPDGDVDVPGVEYSSFRYPACAVCSGRLGKEPSQEDVEHLASGMQLPPQHHLRPRAAVDKDGALLAESPTGILKPGVVMFGESVSPSVKTDAENKIDEADKILVVGSSLATYSAWRLVKRGVERGCAIGVLNIGGVRGESGFFGDGEKGKVRVSLEAEKVLPMVVERVRQAMGN